MVNVALVCELHNYYYTAWHEQHKEVPPNHPVAFLCYYAATVAVNTDECQSYF